jgi:hypothetical protein
MGAYEARPGVPEPYRPAEDPVTQPDTHDARDGSGDAATDPAAIGEKSFEEPDADGGAVVEGADEQP